MNPCAQGLPIIPTKRSQTDFISIASLASMHPLPIRCLDSIGCTIPRAFKVIYSVLFVFPFTRLNKSTWNRFSSHNCTPHNVDDLGCWSFKTNILLFFCVATKETCVLLGQPDPQGHVSNLKYLVDTSIWPVTLSRNDKVHDFKSWYWFWN